MAASTALGKVSRLIWKLNDAHLVADFQQLCGIEISNQDSGLNSASEDIDSSDTPENCEPAESVDGVGRRPKRLHEDCKDSAHSSFSEGDSPPSTATGQTSKSQIVDSKFGILKFSMMNNVSYKVNNRFLFYLFHLSSCLGNEEFLCYFFPYWFWNIDGFVCRRVILVWCIGMYLGQAAKDLICMPRPGSPPVAKLDRKYHLEYGMPSTHAMVGYSIPFSILTLTTARYVYPYWVGLVICILWTTLVCLSRLYLGMHSVLDVVVGLLSAVILLPLILAFADVVDTFQMTFAYGPVVITCVGFLLGLCYPPLKYYNSARGDTLACLGICSGVAAASWLAFNHGLYTRPLNPPPYVIVFPDIEFVVTTAIRMSLGGTIIMATRSLMKTIVYRFTCFLHGLDSNKREENMVHLRVELPYKFFVYYSVSFAIVYIAPYVFKSIGVERVTAFTEL